MAGRDARCNGNPVVCMSSAAFVRGDRRRGPFHVALEHTFEDVYASAAPAAERRTGVRFRESTTTTRRNEHTTSWPFSTPAYLAALDAAHDAVLIIDRSGNIRYVNPACRALLERARPEGRHLLEVMTAPPSLLRGVLRSLRTAPSSASSASSAMWRGVATVGIQGNPHELELSVAVVKVDDWGRAHGFSIIARPLQRPSRALARDVFATLARVVGAAAHDFNNQISVVLNYSFILLRELPNNERPERAHMDELQQAAWRAADTARQLLRLGGKRGPEPAALDVNDVIRDAHAALSMFARNQSEVELRLSQKPCVTKARQSELEWLLLELTQRLRTRLGDLEHLSISTSHAAPHIRIYLDAFPFPESGTSSSRLLGRDSEPPETAPRASTQLDYELVLEALPDDGLRYAIELPAI